MALVGRTEGLYSHGRCSNSLWPAQVSVADVEEDSDAGEVLACSCWPPAPSRRVVSSAMAAISGSLCWASRPSPNCFPPGAMILGSRGEMSPDGQRGKSGLRYVMMDEHGNIGIGVLVSRAKLQKAHNGMQIAKRPRKCVSQNPGDLLARAG